MSIIVILKNVQFLLLLVSFMVMFKKYVLNWSGEELTNPPVLLMLNVVSFTPNVTKLTISVALKSYINVVFASMV